MKLTYTKLTYTKLTYTMLTYTKRINVSCCMQWPILVREKDWPVLDLALRMQTGRAGGGRVRGGNRCLLVTILSIASKLSKYGGMCAKLAKPVS